jgi:protocatechuate 3,4-dioxygenase beta subunit
MIKMTEFNKLNRRSILKAGVGLAASAVPAAAMSGPAELTPANPEGPFYPKHEQADKDTDLTLIEGHTEHAQGQVIRVTGQVLDEEGKPVEGALVDIWQANAHGRYHHEDDPATAPEDPNFQGWGMVKTDAEGRYAFTTIKPGAYKVDKRWKRPPHIHYKVSRRGFHEITTQMYFAGEALNETDRLLQSVPEDARELLTVDFRETDGVPHGHFPIVLAKVV